MRMLAFLYNCAVSASIARDRNFCSQIWRLRVTPCIASHKHLRKAFAKSFFCKPHLHSVTVISHEVAHFLCRRQKITWLLSYERWRLFLLSMQWCMIPLQSVHVLPKDYRGDQYCSYRCLHPNYKSLRRLKNGAAILYRSTNSLLIPCDSPQSHYLHTYIYTQTGTTTITAPTTPSSFDTE